MDLLHSDMISSIRRSFIYIYIHISSIFFHKRVDTEKLLRDAGWLDRSGGLVEYNDDEVTRVEDESPESQTSAFQAFNQGRNMPPRLQRSIHALQATPPQMLKADIQLRPAQLEGAELLC